MTILAQLQRHATNAIFTTVFLGMMTVIASEAKADDSLHRQINKIGIDYQLTDNGDYRFILPLGKGRTQLVIVSKQIQQVGSLRVRQVYSPGYIGTQAPSGEMARRLLEDSEKVKVGAWSLMRGTTRHMASFTVKINANADVEDLRTAIFAAAARADQIEQELTGKDDL